MVIVETRNGTLHTVDAESGNLMYELQWRLQGPWGQCGGCCACATCHAVVQEGWEHLPAMEEDAQALLEWEPNSTDRSVLCCQIDLADIPKDVIIKLKVPHSD